MLPEDWGDGYPNVWLGMTAENQKHFDQRWKHLQKIPASITFISYEPAIGPLRMPARGPYPNWLISGGESGGQSRLLNPQWVRDVINDCRRIGIAAFHKQWGTYRNNPLVVEQGLSVQSAQRMDEFGKGGGLLDGQLVREFPSLSCQADRRAA
jgi:protein gp37